MLFEPKLPLTREKLRDLQYQTKSTIESFAYSNSNWGHIISKIELSIAYLAFHCFLDRKNNQFTSQKRITFLVKDFLSLKRVVTNSLDMDLFVRNLLRSSLISCESNRLFPNYVGYYFSNSHQLYYLAGLYLTRVYRTPEKLFDFLIANNLFQKQWRIVIIYALAIQYRNFEAEDEIIDLILNTIDYDNFQEIKAILQGLVRLFNVNYRTRVKIKELGLLSETSKYSSTTA